MATGTESDRTPWSRLLLGVKLFWVFLPLPIKFFKSFPIIQAYSTGNAMLDYRRFREICELFASGKSERARRLLMEMQSRCIGLRDEIAMLKLRIEELEISLNLAQNMESEQGFYWLRVNGGRQGPFCPRCYEADGALIRLENQDGARSCPYCGEMFDSGFGGEGGRACNVIFFETR